VALALPLFAACSGDTDGSEPVVRDSAGVRIVESPGPAWATGEGWRISDARVTIGVVEGAHGEQLDDVRGAVRLADGTIVIANGGSAELFRYALDGTFLDAFGGRGEGPGEFLDLTWIGTNADSILVWDRTRGRVTVHSAAGRMAREYRPALPEGVLAMDHEGRGGLSGGRILLRSGPTFVPTGGEFGLQRQPLGARLVSATGETIRELGPFPSEEIHLREGRQPGTIIRTPVLLGGATLFAAGGERVYVADNAAYDIRAYDAEGALVGIFRRAHQPSPVRPEERSAAVDAYLEGVPPVEEIREAMRASLESVPIPEFLPAIRALRVDSEGFLWVEAFRRLGERVATWSVFDPSDGWLGDLTLEAGLQPLDIGVDYLLVLLRDDLDVEYVRLLDLHRSS